MADIALPAAILQNAAMIEEAENMVYHAHGFRRVKLVGFGGVQGKGFGIPNLPVIIQSGAVIGMGCAQHNIRQSKALAKSKS